MSSIQIRNVDQAFGKDKILSDISLSVQKGELFGFLGPSGSGKTTLVKMLAGVDAPSSGSVDVLGERMPQLKIMERIGYMAQSDALYPELTAQDNVLFFSALYRLSTKQAIERMHEVMTIVGLTDHMNKLVSNYSGGMKRRLSLAIALMHNPEILLLDEPTVGIDPILRKSVWKEFRQLANNGVTIIVTTHVMDEAEKCDRLGMIRDGKLIATGTPDDLRQATNTASIEEAFLAYGGASK